MVVMANEETTERLLEGDKVTATKETKTLSWIQRPWFKLEAMAKVLMVLLIILASIVLLNLLWQVVGTFSGLLLLFFAAWLLALILTPLVRTFVSFGLPKALAVTATFLVVLAGLAGFMVLILPGLIIQTTALINNLGPLTNDLTKTVNTLLKEWGVTIDLNQLSSQLQSFGTEILKNALGFATGLASFLLQLLLLFIISFSLLAGRDYVRPTRKAMKTSPAPPTERTSFWQRLPERYRRRWEFVRLSFESNFGVFLGGQLAVALIYGLTTWIIMWIAGFDYPLTTGCVCGVLMIIPFFGGPLSLLPPLIVGFSRNDSPIIIVLIVLFVIQTALLNVLLPKMVGSTSGFSPVATLFVLLAGAQIAGIFGVLMAVPVAGVIKSLSTRLLADYVAREEIYLASLTPNGPPTETKIETEISSRLETQQPVLKT